MNLHRLRIFSTLATTGSFCAHAPVLRAFLALARAPGSRSEPAP